MKKLSWMLALALLLGWFMDSMWSSSVDVAHHYTLIARLGEFFHLPREYDTSLGEMHVYPRGAHFIAAMLGMLLGSNLLGMHLLSLLALAAIWGGLIWLSLNLPRPLRWWVLAAMLLLLGLNHAAHLFQLHGAELIGNFFFAQIVAQAGLVLTLLLAFWLERDALWQRNLAMTVMAWVLAYVHLLPVIELLAMLAFLLLFDWLARRTLAQALNGLFWLIIATLLVVKHPNFAPMLGISKNEGLFAAASAHRIGSVLAYCVAVLLFSAVLLRQWWKMDQQKREQWRAGKYFVLYGMAAAGLCLMQVLALKFGQGSMYAVGKYMFSVNTALVLDLALLAGWYCTRFSSWQAVAPGNGWAALAMVLAVVAVLPGKKRLDTAELITLERDLVALERTQIAPQAGKFSYVSDLNKADGKPHDYSIPYMFSLGIFKAPRAAMVYDILNGKPITRLGQANTFISSTGSRLDRFPQCRRLQTGHALVVLDAECLARESGIISVFFDLSQPLKDWPCKIDGFGIPEPFGRWSIASKAAISCAVPQVKGKFAKKLVIDAGAFLQRIELQRLDIVQNGGTPQHYQFDQKHPNQILTLAVQPDAAGQIRLDFSMPDARTPAALGFGPDVRELGISIQSLEFQ